MFSCILYPLLFDVECPKFGRSFDIGR